MVLGIWGSFVWRMASLAAAAADLAAAAAAAAELREELLFGVRMVPDGESVAATAPPPAAAFSAAGGRGNLLRSQACRRAELGVIRVVGSHSRQRRMKSRKSRSSQPFRAVCSSRDPGGPRGFPRRERPPFSTVVPSGSVVAVQYLQIVPLY